MNYFELFELKVAPIADKSVMAQKYFELQKKFHPDFYTNADEADKENATMQSAEINKAFNIFRDPEKTIEYFLQLRGEMTSEEKFNLPADFLMEMMELNEAFDGENKTVLENRIAVFEEGLHAEIESLLPAEKADTLSNDDLQRLKEYIYKKKYLKRILERLDD